MLFKLLFASLMIWHGCHRNDDGGDDDDGGCDTNDDDAHMDEGQIYLFCNTFPFPLKFLS